MATPKIIPYTVKLRSVVPEKTFSKPPVVYTNELRSAEFQFKITDMDASELLTATAKTMLYMRDGSFFQNPSTDVSRAGNVFSYLLKENEGNHAGIAKIQLVVYFNEGLANEQNFPTQLYEFEIINGLETKVAQEVMIHDWTTLTREARAFLDDAELAETGRVTAEGKRVTAESNRVTAESGRVTAEGNRVTAESGRLTAETNRAAAFTAFGTRLTAEETATAANKISAVKGKTFADVDSRFEDVEFDTTLMGTNGVSNGDFSNGTNGWGVNGGTMTTANNEATVTSTSLGGSVGLYRAPVSGSGNKLYVSGEIYPKYGTLTSFGFNAGETISFYPTPNTWNRKSAVLKNNASSIVFYHQFSSSEYVITDTIRFSRLLTIDLTATFGKGNEPTAEQMDAILAKFPNSWFDGTKNLFRAKEALTKQIAIDARTEFDAKNLVVNGDFSNGTTGWTVDSTYSTGVVANNTLSLKSKDAYWNIARKFTGYRHTVGNKLYIRAKLRTTNASRVQIRKGNTTEELVGFNVMADTWQTLSGIWDTTGASGEIVIRIDKYGSTVVGDILDIQYVSVIDLTATFGAGKEPTLAEMDRLMARYPNSWFDGVKPIQTIETLYQEKANKVQEAWITPTLQNGWTASDVNFYPVRYYKDEFGIVRLKGRIQGGTATTAITLPVGYRPDSSQLSFLCHISNTDSVCRVAITNTGAVIIATTLPANQGVYLDSISFKGV